VTGVQTCALPISSPFRALSAGKATSFTTFSLADSVPTTSRVAIVRLTNTDASFPLRFTTSDASGDVSQGCVGISPDSSAYIPANVNSSQQMQYRFISSPAGGGYVDVFGYLYER